MTWRRRKKPPALHPDHPRPQGVAILRRNGERIPVELAFGGIDEETGCADWIIDTAVDIQHGDQIHVDVMPPKAGITWPAGGLG